ncbi:MAG: 50S ribosomal protein L40e [Caldisphaeraceae archaeon]|nr:50S ribosomal protein L40e [Caldisphaeraceae archaeon]
MPITDPELIRIVERRLFDVKICRRCGAKNPLRATKCRRCKSTDLRLKKKATAKYK